MLLNPEIETERMNEIECQVLIDQLNPDGKQMNSIKIKLKLTPKEKMKNLASRLGFSRQAPLVTSFHITLPSSWINASLSQDLKSSILFLLTIDP